MFPRISLLNKKVGNDVIGTVGTKASIGNRNRKVRRKSEWYFDRDFIFALLAQNLPVQVLTW